MSHVCNDRDATLNQILVNQYTIMKTLTALAGGRVFLVPHLEERIAETGKLVGEPAQPVRHAYEVREEEL